MRPDRIEPERIHGERIRSLQAMRQGRRDEILAAVEAEIASVNWMGIAAASGMDPDQRAVLETKRMGMTENAGAQHLGWTLARFRNAARRLRRILADVPLAGRRSEFVASGTAISRNPVSRRRIAGHQVYELERLNEENFGTVMRREVLQPVERKHSVREMSVCVEGKMQHKNLGFELKAVTDAGFAGLLSTYGPPADTYGDIVDPGAFDQSLADNGGKVPLLLDHDPCEQVGLLELKSTSTALEARGVFNLDLQAAVDARAKLKFNLANGLRTGLSIGFMTVKDAIQNGIRHLQQVQLFEGSLTLFPANPAALVQSAKHLTPVERELREFRLAAANAFRQAFGMRPHASYEAMRAAHLREEVRGFFDEPQRRA